MMTWQLDFCKIPVRNESHSPKIAHANSQKIHIHQNKAVFCQYSESNPLIFVILSPYRALIGKKNNNTVAKILEWLFECPFPLLIIEPTSASTPLSAHVSLMGAHHATTHVSRSRQQTRFSSRIKIENWHLKLGLTIQYKRHATQKINKAFVPTLSKVGNYRKKNHKMGTRCDENTLAFLPSLLYLTLGIRRSN